MARSYNVSIKVAHPFATPYEAEPTGAGPTAEPGEAEPAT